MLQVGSLLDNKYKILSEVGHGGMSVVYLAINERANKTWAVKEVRKDGVVDFESVKQGLVVETDMLKKLNHSHLPSIIDVIDTADSFLIVMDYIEGSSLQKLLKTEGAQSEERVVKWGRQLCDVLGYLHRQNPPIIYRDMKPANVMLKPDGDITLIDFGTAREFKNRTMVEDTTCLGTRGYAAPEQFGGRGQTDARTDIYCLGATLYHLLTGHSPAEPPYEIKPISYWIPQYAGSGLEKLILKCTQQDPNARYQNCEELMYALEHYRDEDDVMQRQRKNRWRAFLASAIIGVAGLIGFIGFMLARNGAQQATYDSLVNQAQMQDSLQDAEGYIRQALDMDAGGTGAYRALISKVDTDINKNDGLTSEAASIFKGCLEKHTANGRSYIEALAAKDPDTYTDVMYNAGLWYFFMRNDGDYRMQASDSYFSKINDETHLQYLRTSENGTPTPEVAELVPLLDKIGSYVGSLNSATGKYNTTEASYANLFNDLSEIVSGDLKAKVSKDIYCIKIYEQVATWVNVDMTNFISGGIGVEQLNSLLDTVDEGLKGLNIDSDNVLYEDYRNALSAVSAAKDLVASRAEKN